MTTVGRILASLAASACLATCLSSCYWIFAGSGYPSPEFTGIEAPELAERARGTLVWIEEYRSDQLDALDLTTGARRSFELDGEPLAFSGPDGSGQVAFLESTGWWFTEHRIVVVSLRDGSARTILEGDRELSMHSQLEIAPRGGRIAFVRAFGLSGFRSTIQEILILDEHGAPPVVVPAQNPDWTRPRWFPDGRRLAYVEKPPGPLDGETWNFDVESGTRTFLAKGRIDALSPDGTAALIATWPKRLRVVDTATGAVLEDDVFIPGPLLDGRGWAIALLAPNLVIHAGGPPRGEEQELVRSFVAPGACYPIRETDLESDRSAILVPKTWNWRMSYGEFELGAAQ